MLKILKKSKIFLILMIFINVSSLIASELHNFPTVQSQSPFANKGDIIKQLYNEDGLLVYDSVLKLIEDIENGNLDDVCTDEEWQKINYFIASLAKHGMMPNTTDEEKTEIERDIQELLYVSEKDFRFENSSYTNDNYWIIHAICYGRSETVHCKNWFKKQYNHTKKFVKKHKTAVIVATVIVVAVAAVAITIAVVPSTAAIATAATTGAVATTKAASDSSTPKSNDNKTIPSNDTSIKLPNNPGDNINRPTLTQSIDNQINDIKNAIVENNLLPSNQNFPSTEYDRIIGSTLAHEALSNAPQNLSTETYEQKIIQGHVKIDNAFSTEQTSYYLDNKNLLSNSSKELQEKIYYFQGQEALNTHYYDQAIDSFGKAIEINPNNPNVYLDRAFAHLKAGEFDKSLNDYHIYNEQKNNLSEKAFFLSDSIDFSLGVRTGITKGTIESGKELLSFAANAITHPIDTTCGIYEAFSSLAKLACSQEWKTLSKALAPEICELVNEWKNLSAKEKGEKSGYILGKYGTDILVPGAAAKVISKSVKGAKELIVIAKNFQKTEKLIVIEALAGSGGRSGAFAEVLCKTKTAERFLPHASDFLKNIKTSSFLTNIDILNFIKPNGKFIGLKGSNNNIRLIAGNHKEAVRMFKKLTKNAQLNNSKTYEGLQYKLKDGTFLGYRTKSKFGPPTIDINIPNEEYYKIKFIGKK